MFTLNWRANLVITGSLLGSFFLACFLTWVTASAAYLGWNGQVNHVPTALEEKVEHRRDKTGGKGECRINAGFPAGVQQWCEQITYYAGQHDLPPDLVASVVWLESGGQPQAYSHSGAVGLMQVMPRDGLAANFICANGPCFHDRPTIAELNDPEFNLAYGTQLLSDLVQRRGSLREALRSYGPKDAGYTYADQVLGIYERLRARQ